MTQHDLIDLLQYNSWANQRILRCARQISTEELLGPANFDHESAFQTLRHMLDVAWSWRLMAQLVPATQLLWEVEDLSDLAKVMTFWQMEEATMLAYVQSLDEQSINATVEYGTAQGRSPQSTKLWQIIAHVIDHGTHHRSELARYCTNCDHSPGNLSFMGFLSVTSR